MSTRGMGGYGIVPEAEQSDVGKARDRLRAGGFDGAMIARLGRRGGPAALVGRQPPAGAALVPHPRELLRHHLPGDRAVERSPPHGCARPDERVRGRLRSAGLVGGQPDLQPRGDARRGRATWRRSRSRICRRSASWPGGVKTPPRPVTLQRDPASPGRRSAAAGHDRLGPGAVRSPRRGASRCGRRASSG